MNRATSTENKEKRSGWKQGLIDFAKKALGENYYADVKYFYYNLRHARGLRLNGRYSKDTFFFVIDPNIKHPGLADRIKAIVRSYNIAKQNGYRFKLIYKVPFCLEDYLNPNEVDWVADYSDLGNDLTHVRFFNETSWHKHDNKLKVGKEYDCFNYIGNNLPDSFADTGYRWKDLFHELFKPSTVVAEMGDSLLPPPPPRELCRRPLQVCQRLREF